MDTPYNKLNRCSYSNKHYPELTSELDIYGSVRNFSGHSLSDCPFRYQGQYEDEEN